MLGEEEDNVFESVAWETPAHAQTYTTQTSYSAPTAANGDNDMHDREALSTGPGYRQRNDSMEGNETTDPKWEGYLITSVQDPVKEMAETKDAYVSYLVSAKTNLPTFTSRKPSSRRRFTDFVFLHDHLAKDFPACVVPPLPNKHRMEYITGDRFGIEFMERRCADLDLFLTRVSRHPTLQRSTLMRAFLEATDWHVQMHHHIAHPPGPEPAPGVLDNISDTLLNAFARVRKPDERFLAMRDTVDKFEEGIINSERIWARIRARTDGLAGDHHDLAIAIQGLGFLESGITEPLNHFSNALLEISELFRHSAQKSFDPFLFHMQSLLSYSHAHRAVLKLRDQKQLDLEELTDYLSGVTAERDRLAAIVSGRAGSTSLGIGAYLRDRVDAIRGADDDRSRVEKMKKLDVKIKELQDAVTTAHETSDAFSNETLKERTVFQRAKEAEMKQSLGALADTQMETYRAAIEEMNRLIPSLQRIRVDL